MNPKRLLLFLLATTVFAVSSRAAVTESHRAAIEHLFTVLKIDRQYEVAMFAGFEGGLNLTPERLAAMTEDQRTKLQAGVARMKAKMNELMGWEKVKSDMVEIYAKHFSEAEINDITKMMESPTGQMMVSKQLALMPDSMALAQQKARSVMPELVKIMQEESK